MQAAGWVMPPVWSTHHVCWEGAQEPLRRSMRVLLCWLPSLRMRAHTFCSSSSSWWLVSLEHVKHWCAIECCRMWCDWGRTFDDCWQTSVSCRKLRRCAHAKTLLNNCVVSPLACGTPAAVARKQITSSKNLFFLFVFFENCYGQVRVVVFCVCLHLLTHTKKFNHSALLHQRMWDNWLILPVVICLSQRLSHACLSMNSAFVLWNCEWLIKSVMVSLIVFATLVLC